MPLYKLYKKRIGVLKMSNWEKFKQALKKRGLSFMRQPAKTPSEIRLTASALLLLCKERGF